MNMSGKNIDQGLLNALQEIYTAIYRVDGNEQELLHLSQNQLGI